ncbi:20650_t:CDS:2 [Cetraspora pellucida]|uniref:20650_t:CDS:1 n=1 Tax=Cetraspora pellucida TaxID=1433469 RepID=A0A9N9NJC2_9GLOM|nr:20650_t:CDS:2 [Cetraspora pellucida]
MSFIDGGCLPYESDNPCSKPLTTNNFTERMNKSLENQHGNTKTVADFVENLYSIQKIHSTLSEKNSGQLNFHTGLVTYWNTCTLDHENEEYHFAIDKKRRLNQGRYYVLCGWIKNIENSNYFYVKKGNNSFRSLYNSAPIKINREIQLEIDKIVGKLASKHNIEIPSQYYLVNIQSEESTIKSNFIQYFWNKEKALPANAKNYIIYSGVEDEAFQEIVSLYNEVGDAIFYPYKRQLAEKDPFRPLELSECNTMTYGSPKIHGAKKCSPTYPILEMHLEHYEENFNSLNKQQIQKEILPLQEKYVHSNTSNSQTIQATLPHSIQRRNTTRIRNLKRDIQKNIENINLVNLPQKHKHVNDTQETLEAIFLEQGITWKPRAFTNFCISKNIHLANNPVVNDRLIYSWISRPPIRSINKNCTQLMMKYCALQKRCKSAVMRKTEILYINN